MNHSYRFTLPVVLLAASLVWAGCQSLYTGTVTLTAVVRAAADEYAKIYNDGLVPPDVHAKVSAAHLAYRKASGVAADTLEAYKAGKTNDLGTAIEAARVAAMNFVALLVDLLPKQRVAELQLQIKKADVP